MHGVFAGVVVIEGGDVDPGRLGNLSHARSGQPALPDLFLVLLWNQELA